MTAVCVKARLSERYFYETFANRDELLVAVMDRIASRIQQAVLDALVASAGSPHQRARAAITAFVDLLTSDSRIGRAAILESASAEPLRARRHELLRHFAHLIAAQARTFYGEHAWPPPRDEVNGLLFAGGLAELLMAWLTGELSASRDDIIDTATAHFVRAAQY